MSFPTKSRTRTTSWTRNTYLTCSSRRIAWSCWRKQRGRCWRRKEGTNRRNSGTGISMTSGFASRTAMWSSLLLHRWSGSSMATSRCSLRTDHTTTTTTTTHQDHPASVFSPPSSSYLSAHVWQSPHTCTLFFYRPRWYKTHLHKNWDWSKNVKETQVYVMVQMEKYVNKSMLSTDSSGTTT